MEDMESRLNAVLGNPDMMQKIMSMAQSLQAETPVNEVPPSQSPFEGIDINMMQKIAGFVGQNNIDNNQRNLLNALTPYLTGDRVTRLEKAMRAAKLANVATSFLGSSGLFSGR